METAKAELYTKIKHENAIKITQKRIAEKKDLNEYVCDGESRKITPLYYFSFSDNDIEFTCKLLEAGANPNISSENYRNYPLLNALKMGAWQNAQALLKNNANPFAKDTHGRSALHLLCNSDFYSTQVIKIDTQRRLLARLLLHTKKVNPNTQTWYGGTPIGELIESNEPRERLSVDDRKFLIKLFISYGANIWMKLRYKQSVLVSFGGTCGEDEFETRDVIIPLIDKYIHSPNAQTKELVFFTKKTYALWHLLLFNNRWEKEHAYQQGIPKDVLKIIATIASN